MRKEIHFMYNYYLYKQEIAYLRRTCLFLAALLHENRSLYSYACLIFIENMHLHCINV